MNNIDKELDDMSLTGPVISDIFCMEDIPDDSWNIGMESKKYGARLAKSICIDKYCVNKISNRISIKNIKECFGN